MPASTSETAARLLSSSFDSTFSDLMTFIGHFLFRVERARMSPARRSNAAISPAEFDHIGANLRRRPGLSRELLFDRIAGDWDRRSHHCPGTDAAAFTSCV